jgi:hypothetical protein
MLRKQRSYADEKRKRKQNENSDAGTKEEAVYRR